MFQHFSSINGYLEAANCTLRAKEPDFLLIKFADLNEETVTEMAPCRRDFYQINFIIHPGTGRYLLKNQHLDQTPNTLFFISPEHLYGWVRDSSLQGYLLYFKKAFLHFFNADIALVFQRLFGLDRENQLPLQVQQVKQLHASFEQLYLNSRAALRYKRSILGADLLSLLYQILEMEDQGLITTPEVNHQVLLYKQFKNLVDNLFLEERKVSQYAQRLHPILFETLIVDFGKWRTVFDKTNILKVLYLCLPK